MKRAILRPEGTTLKRSAGVSLPPFELKRKTREPLHVQLARQLRRLIASGAAPARLPSTRALAAHLQLSRNTVVAAYESLGADGVLESKRGSGTRRRPAATGLLKRSDLLRDSHYPFAAQPFHDPDGHPIYFHR